jgi:hypothetical protein
MAVRDLQVKTSGLATFGLLLAIVLLAYSTLNRWSV